MFRVDGDGVTFALKWYPRQTEDSRDRLGSEYTALRFLAENGNCPTPVAYGIDRDAGVALYEWIDGTPIGVPSDKAIDEAVAFINRLKALSTSANLRGFGPASEACFSAAELVDQVERRCTRLEVLSRQHPKLAEYLGAQFRPAFERLVGSAMTEYARLGADFSVDLDLGKRILSPSDMGFHNALCSADGSLVFLDFEYFGWDDPVKLVADFILHPGMNLDVYHQERFRRGALDLFIDDPWFAERLHILFPLYGLRWCMILLNEFLPERWTRRSLSGATATQEKAQERQLNKAYAALATLKRSSSWKTQ